MKIILLTLLVGFFTFFANLKNDFWRIFEQNSGKDKAEKAFVEGRFRAAADAYFYLVKELKEGKEAAELNLGHSYFKIPDTLAAARYNALLNAKNPIVRSIAHQQLGYLKIQKSDKTQRPNPKTQKKNTEEALEHFKNSLRADPNNGGSRYNYELLKRVKAQQEENQEDKQDQEKEDKEKQEQEQEEKEKQEKEKSEEQKKQEEQDKKDQEKSEEEKEKEKSDEQKENENKKDQEKSDEEKEKEQKEALKDRLKEMNITAEKAEMLLEAMKNSEVQYLQQNRKKQTKKRDTNKPDW